MIETNIRKMITSYNYGVNEYKSVFEVNEINVSKTDVFFVCYLKILDTKLVQLMVVGSDYRC